MKNIIFICLSAILMFPGSAYPLRPVSTSLFFEQQLKTAPTGGRGERLYSIDQNGDVTLKRSQGRGWPVDETTGARLYLGPDARARLLIAGFGMETQIVNAYGRNITFTVDGESFSMDKQGVIILQEVPPGVDIEFQNLEGADVVVEIASQPQWYKRFYEPAFQHIRDELLSKDAEERYVDSEGYDISGLISPIAWVSKGVMVYDAASRLNPWDGTPSVWISNNLCLRSPVMSISLVQHGGDSRNVSFNGLLGSETMHKHPPVNMEGITAVMKELYIPVEGAMGLMAVSGENEHFFVLKQGDALLALPGTVHGIFKANLPYLHIVVQIPGAFQYGFMFKEVVQPLDEFMAGHPHAGGIDRIMENDRPGAYLMARGHNLQQIYLAIDSAA